MHYLMKKNKFLLARNWLINKIVKRISGSHNNSFVFWNHINDFDPNIINNSGHLSTYYDADHFIGVLIGHLGKFWKWDLDTIFELNFE